MDAYIGTVELVEIRLDHVGILRNMFGYDDPFILAEFAQDSRDLPVREVLQHLSKKAHVSFGQPVTGGIDVLKPNVVLRE
jgi:hypothetical protein